MDKLFKKGDVIRTKDLQFAIVSLVQDGIVHCSKWYASIEALKKAYEDKGTFVVMKKGDNKPADNKKPVDTKPTEDDPKTDDLDPKDPEQKEGDQTNGDEDKGTEGDNKPTDPEVK